MSRWESAEWQPPMVTILESDWEPTGDEGFEQERLNAVLQIGNTYFHVLAIAVHTNEDGVQVATCEGHEAEINQVYDVVGGDGPWETVRINDRDFVLIITPFCQ